MSAIFRSTESVRSSDAGIGQLGDPHQVLLVLRRDEPGGHRPEDQHRERQQAGVHGERPARPSGEALHAATVALRAAP